MSIELVMLSNHLILCHTLLFLLSIFPRIGVHSNESILCIRWPKYWSFSISPSNEYSGLISFKIGWFDLLAIQGTLESLLQHQSLKASILQCPAFFMVQLSHLYMTTQKIIALITLFWQSDISAFLYSVQLYHSFPTKEQASFNFTATVTIFSDFGVQRNKVCHCVHFFPFYLP